jgi:hypothetical protein
MPTPLRVSSLHVTSDLTAACKLYDELGLEREATDDPGCIGFVAGSTGVILTDHDFAIRCWGRDIIGELSGRCVPYIFLEALGDSQPRNVIAESWTWFGTHELVVRTAAGPVIFVERAARQLKDHRRRVKKEGIMRGLLAVVLLCLTALGVSCASRHRDTANNEGGAFQPEESLKALFALHVFPLAR